MQNFILFISACLGATFIINISYIFKPVREKAFKLNKHLGKLLSCPMCMGFWVGIFIRTMFMWHDNELSNLQFNDLYNIIYGFTSSFFCYFLYLILKPLMEKYD